MQCTASSSRHSRQVGPGRAGPAPALLCAANPGISLGCRVQGCRTSVLGWGHVSPQGSVQGVWHQGPDLGTGTAKPAGIFGHALACLRCAVEEEGCMAAPRVGACRGWSSAAEQPGLARHGRAIPGSGGPEPGFAVFPCPGQHRVGAGGCLVLGADGVLGRAATCARAGCWGGWAAGAVREGGERGRGVEEADEEAGKSH